MDNEPLPTSHQYELDNGVLIQFAFQSLTTQQFDIAGVFERRGTTGDTDASRGFASPQGTSIWDTGRSSFYNDLLGLYFLRPPGSLLENPGQALRIDFGNNAGMRYFSGEIWDIDSFAGNAEQWRIRAFSSNGELSGAVQSPRGIDQASQGSLDSLPWVFELIAPQDIDYIVIDYIGDERLGVGLAFNNFTTAVTLPADFDSDFDIDGDDLAVWRLAYAESAAGDADADDDSDGNDFLAWQRQVGLSAPPLNGRSVPEPDSVSIIAAFVGFAVCTTARRCLAWPHDQARARLTGPSIR